ncbi:ATP-binding cassette domain-containing protein [Virgisporangium aurantiacum]|uniref:ABC transporter ATP-binding protein n=1 Tax=Virgisporangium aurantiacum TaxID=175570 RepID=A0A8J3ZAD2_9ACTN|nr:ATP-binding cassette domain-containing protein [Virgisporangium aurantiacum]GIJ59238.1 ABC transporter ATP-binding protein [Virgisporangium aurantiacum]
MSLLRVRAVTHTTILRDVDLRLDGSRVAVLAGRSGSGKSTLCHLVAGVMRPSTGEVLVAGEPAHRVDDWAVTSLLPQRLALSAEMTVAENASLPARLRGRPDDPDLLARLGLDGIADRPAGATSLGEQQRTALARALVLRPAVAVLDEPTGHQDDEHVGLILDALVTAARAGTLVLVATHDQRVIDIADDRIHLNSGRVSDQAG